MPSSIVYQQPSSGLNAINTCLTNSFGQCPNVLLQPQIHNPVVSLPVVQKTPLYTPVTHKTVLTPTHHKPLIIPHIHKPILRPPIIPKPLVIPILPKSLISPIQDAILPIKIIPFFQSLLDIFGKSVGLQSKSNYLQPVTIQGQSLNNIIDYPKTYHG